MLLFTIIILPLASALVAFGLKDRQVKWIELASMLSMGIVLALSLFAAYLTSTGVMVASSVWFELDPLSAIILSVIAFVGTNAMLYSSGYLSEEEKKGYVTPKKMREYYILLNAFLFAMFLAASTTSPVLMWIAIEATTLATVFLISFYNKTSSIEAAWKYVVINSVGLLLGFFGMILLIASIGATGGESLLSWSDLRMIAGGASPLAAHVAFIFILVGFGTKVGLAPMHTWLPDAHSKAPVPISALLSGVLLNVAFLALVRFKGIVDTVSADHFAGNLMIGFGLLSVVIVAFTLLRQKHYKRLFAYSSIENMGLIAIGTGVGGIGAMGAVLHIIYHALTKSMLFMSSGNIFLKYSSTKIDSVRGMIRTLPKTSIVFFLGIFILVGMPPFGIFASKFAILSAATNTSIYLLVALLLALILVFVGFLRHAALMLYGEPNGEIAIGEHNSLTLIPLFVILVVLIVLSLYVPAPIAKLIGEASLLVNGNAH
jgi:hydrogenase-4 component F